MSLKEDIIQSFKTGNQGMSARKLTSFFLCICIGYCHYKFVDQNNVVAVIGIDLLAIGVLLGLVTMEQIISLKNGKSDEPKGVE